MVQLVEESTRATGESVKYFIEPSGGVLDKAKSKRNHIIFGRRGSGKSSLLQKVTSDLTVNRTPIAYIDLEKFKSHSYPDVLISVLLSTLTEVQKWLDTAAINPATKTSFWKKFFGSVPTKGALPKKKVTELSQQFGLMVEELSNALFQADELKKKETEKSDTTSEIKQSAQFGTGTAAPIKAGVSSSAASKEGQASELQTEYTSHKIEILHRNILRYKSLFEKLAELAGGPSFLLLDDLYHLRLSDQAKVLDYFFRIAKGANLWIKVGTIRHRSRWYERGDPSIGMKLGDDADEIDLDATLEKFDLTKNFLFKILGQFAADVGVKISDIIVDGGKDRLVLASGGVARDFLNIFRQSVEATNERIVRGELTRGPRIGTEDVNKAAGDQGQFKEEDFTRDTSQDDQSALRNVLEKITEFCISKAGANCILVEKDTADQATVGHINELVDLKFLHRAQSRVTVRDRTGRLYDAYMLDISRYVGERTRRNLDILAFWESNDVLRRTRLIYLERPYVPAS